MKFNESFFQVLDHEGNGKLFTFSEWKILTPNANLIFEPAYKGSVRYTICPYHRKSYIVTD